MLAAGVPTEGSSLPGLPRSSQDPDHHRTTVDILVETTLSNALLTFLPDRLHFCTQSLFLASWKSSLHFSHYAAAINKDPAVLRTDAHLQERLLEKLQLPHVNVSEKDCYALKQSRMPTCQASMHSVLNNFLRSPPFSSSLSSR